MIEISGGKKMWERFTKQNALCARYRTGLEDLPAGAGVAEASAELPKTLPAELAGHVEHCDDCKEAAEVFWASRQLLAAPLQQRREEFRARTADTAPWFTARVMAKIATRDAEVRAEKTEWSGAVTKLASRLAWVSGLLLLVTSTWLYNPSDGALPKQNSGQGSATQSAAEAPQYLFDSTTAPSNIDDALASPRGEAE